MESKLFLKGTWLGHTNH